MVPHFVKNLPVEELDMFCCHIGIMLDMVGGHSDPAVAPEVYAVSHNSDTRSPFLTEVLEFYNHVYRDAAPPAKAPDASDVKALVLGLGMSMSFKSWHADYLRNPNPPTQEAPSAVRFRAQIRAIQTAICKAYPQFFPSTEAWPGQAAACATASIVQTLEGNCLTVAINTAAMHGRKAMTLKGDSVLFLNDSSSAVTGDALSQLVNAACLSQL
eukprot:7045858-Karenia_brevis.AAC.2